ncbi:MAG: phage holin family protein [Candidatus Dormibacteria bacterium]|jgi:hypothetical protein
MATQDPPPDAPSRTPLIDALREILADTLRFARAEVGLVRAEGTATAKRAAFAAALLAAAAIAVLMVVALLLGAGAAAVGGALGHPWLGWLIMAGFVLVVAALLAGLGYRMIRGAIAEGRKVGGSVKEDLEWVRELVKPNANGS